MLLNCYQRSTFVAPQAALYQPANLQPRLKSSFETAPSLAAGQASPSNWPSKAGAPW